MYYVVFVCAYISTEKKPELNSKVRLTATCTYAVTKNSYIQECMRVCGIIILRGMANQSIVHFGTVAAFRPARNVLIA
jgi:hypothetical protein